MDISIEKSRNVSVLALILGMIVFIFTGCNKVVVEEEELSIVATTTMLYDLVDNITQGEIETIGLMGTGIDPHLYKASAGDVNKLESADLIVYNGLHLEGEMEDIFQQLEGKGKQVICVGKSVDEDMLLQDEDGGGVHDPHIWFNIEIWKDVARYVADAVIAIDPDNSEFYGENLDQYLEELEELEVYVASRADEVAMEQRVIITAHDAFNYFGNAYDFQVKGLQGISTESEAGTGDISTLASYIAENEIKAIFVESSVPTKNIESLQEAVKARGFRVEIGGELYSDSLGDSSTGHDSYIQTFKANIDTIVDALK